MSTAIKFLALLAVVFVCSALRTGLDTALGIDIGSRYGAFGRVAHVTGYLLSGALEYSFLMYLIGYRFTRSRAGV
jgi:hypothetical protein